MLEVRVYIPIPIALLVLEVGVYIPIPITLLVLGVGIYLPIPMASMRGHDLEENEEYYVLAENHEVGDVRKHLPNSPAIFLDGKNGEASQSHPRGETLYRRRMLEKWYECNGVWCLVCR